MPFNTFSLQALLAFMVMTALAGVFAVLYWRLGRRATDGMFSGLMACGGVFSLALFLADNVVPAGALCRQAPGAVRTLFWMRLTYTMGLVAMPIQLHFVFRYCRMERPSAPAVRVMHVAFLLAVPLVWTDLFLRARASPVAVTSCWSVALPWIPRAGPLAMAFVISWLGVQILTQCLLYRYTEARRTAAAGDQAQTSLVRLGLLAPALGGIADIFLSGLGHEAITVLPFTAIFMAALVATALLRERLSSGVGQAHVDHETQLAARIQQDLLPAVRPSIRGFELAGWNRPALATGGDTYDFLELPDRRWFITLGDATGHGMGPALVVAQTRALLRAITMHAQDPSQILYQVDRLLSMDIIQGMLVTCFVGVLDPAAMTISYASAGQGPFFFHKRATGELTECGGTSPPMGMSFTPEPTGEDLRWQLEPGDFMVLVTDGFFEATSPTGEAFGIDRLKQFLLTHGRLPALEMIARLKQELDVFIGTRDQEDDMTMVVLKKL